MNISKYIFYRKKLCAILIIVSMFLISLSSTTVFASFSTSNSVQSTSSNSYSFLWSTSNGTFIKFSLDPIIKSFEAGNSYYFNVTLTAEGLAPNITAVSDINTTLAFSDGSNAHTFYSKSYHFSNITKINQAESQLIPLSFPTASVIHMNVIDSYSGSFYYALHNNETFAGFNDTSWNTGWKVITSATLRSISDSSYTLIQLLFVGGVIFIIAIGVIIYSKQQQKRRSKQLKELRTFQQQRTQPGSTQQQIYQSGTNQQQTNSPSNANQIGQPFQQSQVNNQYLNSQTPPQQYQRNYNQYSQSPRYGYTAVQPNLNYGQELLAKKMVKFQKLTLCKNCSSINLASMSTCYRCATILEVEPEELLKDSFKQKNTILSKLNLILVIQLLAFLFELFMVVSILSLYELAGHNPHFTVYYVNNTLVTNTGDYAIWHGFMAPIAFITTTITMLLFDILPYFLLGRNLKKDSSFTIYKIKSIKNFYLIVPIINVIYLTILGLVFTGGATTPNYDFTLTLTGYGILIGFVTLPIRIFIYLKKYIIPPEVISAYSTQITAQVNQVQVKTSNHESTTGYTPNTVPAQQQTAKELINTTQIQEENVPMFTCPNCQNRIEITSQFCPECGQTIEKCNICKGPILSKDERSYCPHCMQPFHLSHLRESVKISGTCPMCKEPVQDYEILRDKTNAF